LSIDQYKLTQKTDLFQQTGFQPMLWILIIINAYVERYRA